MKLILLTLSIIFMQVPSFAGTSTQDPVVNQLRNDFKVSHSPSDKELLLNSKQICTGFDAAKDNFQRYEGIELTFSRLDGLFHANSAYGESFYFTRTFTGLSGSYNGSMIEVRATINGDLIWEQSFAKEDMAKFNWSSEPAVATSTFFSVRYIRCAH